MVDLGRDRSQYLIVRHGAGESEGQDLVRLLGTLLWKSLLLADQMGLDCAMGEGLESLISKSPRPPMLAQNIYSRERKWLKGAFGKDLIQGMLRVRWILVNWLIEA